MIYTRRYAIKVRSPFTGLRCSVAAHWCTGTLNDVIGICPKFKLHLTTLKPSFNCVLRKNTLKRAISLQRPGILLSTCLLPRATYSIYRVSVWTENHLHWCVSHIALGSLNNTRASCILSLILILTLDFILNLLVCWKSTKTEFIWERKVGLVSYWLESVVTMATVNLLPLPDHFNGLFITFIHIFHI